MSEPCIIDLAAHVHEIISEAAAEANKRHIEFREHRRTTKAWWLGYQSVEQMEDHLPWLETRWPEGAEI